MKLQYSVYMDRATRKIREVARLNNLLLKRLMVIKSILKIVSFLLVVFLLTDVLILIRILLRNYGEALESNNIIKTVIVFGTLTVIFFLLKKYLKFRINKRG